MFLLPVFTFLITVTKMLEKSHLQKEGSVWGHVFSADVRFAVSFVHFYSVLFTG